MLVSHKSGDGYALTAWHNLGLPERDFDEKRRLQGVWYLPRWGSFDDAFLRRTPTVVGRWSNPRQDFAVLKVSDDVIQEFQLQPLPLSFDCHASMRLDVAGFQRPGSLRHASVVPVCVFR